MKYIIEDGCIAIRAFSMKDETLHMKLSKERDIISANFEQVYEMKKADMDSGAIIVYPIVEKSSGQVCGFGQLDMANPYQPEMGIDILDEHMDKGYGYRAVSLLKQHVCSWPNIEYITWKTENHNVKSNRLAQKLGGELVLSETSLPASFIEFGIKQGILSEEDLTYINTYHISLQK